MNRANVTGPSSIGSPHGLVDAHAHVFPTDEAGRRWLEPIGLVERGRTGSISEARRVYEQAGISKVVVLLYLQAPVVYAHLRSSGQPDDVAREQVRREIMEFNQWGCDLATHDPRFIPFVGVDVRFMDAQTAVAEIDRGHRAGAKGVKIVPHSMGLHPDDPLLRPIYQRCSALGLPLLSQAGRSARPGEGNVYGRPIRFRAVLEEFPDLRLILAHLGRDYEDEVVTLTHHFPNVYTDLSLRLSRLGAPDSWSIPELLRTTREIGIDRVLFGTNYPIADPIRYVARFADLPFTEPERESIAHANFTRLMQAG